MPRRHDCGRDHYLIASWVLYGLGAISIHPLTNMGGLRYYQSVFLPSVYRINAEAGVSEKEQAEFFRVLFKAIKQCGRAISSIFASRG